MVDQAAMSEEGMARRGLKALYLETPEAVARDLEAFVCAAFDYLHRQLREVRDERDLKQAECSANSYAHSEARTLIADQSAALALAEGALKKLADKLDEINASSEFQGVWSIFMVRGGVYRGPDWSEALANARNTLAAIAKLKGAGEKG